MDQLVLKTQQWLNETYAGKGGFNTITEDGITGWGTIGGLTAALQIELGLTSDGIWGATTEKNCPTISSNNSGSNKNIVAILQGGLFCKGYDAGDLSGDFTLQTASGVIKLKQDAGLSNADDEAGSMIFKVLLSTMDGFVLANGKDPKIRTIQQNLNRDYYETIGLIPTNGLYSRETNRALIKALQIEEGSFPDGIWGDSTYELCPTIPGSKSNKMFILLLQYSLYVNGKDPNGFDGLFGNGLSEAIKSFQGFCALPVDGYAGKQVWASLLVSTGDSNRKGTACDCGETLTLEKIKTLKNNGYKIVGRYLTGKYKLTANEALLITANEMNILPIYEEYGYMLSHFNQENGYQDAKDAFVAAKCLGFNEDSIIYFAVDCDVMDYQITESIIPYFKGVNIAKELLDVSYKIGIYAARNVCSRVNNAGYSCSSFVCDMSTGFSGNLGYPLPEDWAFDQIKTTRLGSGDGSIEIDNNICKGTYLGEKFLYPMDGDLFNKINNISIIKEFGGNLTTFEEEKEFIRTPNLKIAYAISTDVTVDGDYANLEITPDGKLDGATIKSTFDSMEGSLNKDQSISLANTLTLLSSDIGETSIAYKISTDGVWTTNEISIPVKIYLDKDNNVPITLAVKVKISIKNDGGESDVQEALDSVSEYTGYIITGVVVIGVVGVITYLGGIAAVLGAILAWFAEVLGTILALFGYIGALLSGIFVKLIS